VDRAPGLQPYLKRPCSELSKGNQQKVQVACAAIHEPDLLILDEPFSGLDPVNAEMLVSIMLELSAAARRCRVSHQMWQLERLCTEYCIVAAGLTGRGHADRPAPAPGDSRRARGAEQRAVYAVLDRVAGSVRLAERDGFAEYQIPAAADFSQILRELVTADAISQFETVEPRSTTSISVHRSGTGVRSQFFTIFGAEVRRRLTSRAFQIGLVLSVAGIWAIRSSRNGCSRARTLRRTSSRCRHRRSLRRARDRCWPDATKSWTRREAPNRSRSCTRTAT